jgi:methylmalonyl-CoA epimerase
MNIDHVAIAVDDIQRAAAVYEEALGLEAMEVLEIADQGVAVAFLPVGDVKIELVQPLQTDSGVARFLEKRGEGLHHICIAVPDIEAALDRLRAGGVPLIDQEPRRGAHGRVAFVHPKGLHGALVELLEREEA